MSEVVLQVENVSKQYRLGQLGTGTISHDLNRMFARIRGKEDPYLKLGVVNDRTAAGTENYVWSLKDLSFNVRQGEVLGVIGRNGAGKSTLLKILSQVTTPTEGQIKVKGRIAALLEVGTGFHLELTGRENVFLNGAILGMTKKEINSKFDEIVDFSGVARYIDTPVKRYSSGMLVRLGFAVAAHLEPEILIVDEVLAVGDSEFQEKCLGKMKDVSGQGRTVLFVSHNMAAIKSLCTSCLYLKNGMLESIGLTSEVIGHYKAAFEKESFTGINENPKSTARSEAGRIELIQQTDRQGVVSGEVPFEEQINLEIGFSLSSEISNLNVDVRISNSEGIVVAHLSSLYQKAELLGRQGQNLVRFQIVNQLMPGTYAIEVGLHYPNNTTVDYVKEALAIRVTDFNELTNKSYYYQWPDCGYFRPEFILTKIK